jgi:hypothetical protein
MVGIKRFGRSRFGHMILEVLSALRGESVPTESLSRIAAFGAGEADNMGLDLTHKMVSLSTPIMGDQNEKKQ